MDRFIIYTSPTSKKEFDLFTVNKKPATRTFFSSPGETAGQELPSAMGAALRDTREIRVQHPEW